MRPARAAYSAAVPLLVALAAGSCAPQTAPPPEIDRQAIEAEVTAWLNTYWSTWADGSQGFDRGIAMFDDHPDFSLASDGSLWRSLAEADATFRPVFQTIDHQTFDLPTTVIEVLGQDLVHVAQQGTFTQWNTDGTTVGPSPAAFSFLLVRTEGVWKVRAYHQSEPNAPGGGS